MMNMGKITYKMLLAVGAMFLFSSGAQAASIAMVGTGGSTNITVSEGSTVTLELWVLGMPLETAGGYANFNFDAIGKDLLTFGSFVVDHTTWDINPPFTNDGSYDAATGVYDGGLAVNVPFFGPNVAGDILVGTLTFTADLVGDIVLTANSGIWNYYDLTDPTCIFGTCDMTLTSTITNIAVVSAVPLPPAIWLLGSALIGMMGLSRRKREKLAVAA